MVNTTIWPSGQVVYPSSLPFLVPYEKKHLTSHRLASRSVFSTLNNKKASVHKAYLTEVLEFRDEQLDTQVELMPSFQVEQLEQKLIVSHYGHYVPRPGRSGLTCLRWSLSAKTGLPWPPASVASFCCIAFLLLIVSAFSLWSVFKFIVICIHLHLECSCYEIPGPILFLAVFQCLGEGCSWVKHILHASTGLFACGSFEPFIFKSLGSHLPS